MRASPLYAEIGRRIRQRRQLLGLSQAAFGERLGISFQQVQKYERGIDRVAVDRLFQVANVLETPLAYFLDGLADLGAKANAQAELQLHEARLIAHLRTISDDVREIVERLVSTVAIKAKTKPAPKRGRNRGLRANKY
jgi:transcriptional regulator with XRE-family HTH domain